MALATSVVFKELKTLLDKTSYVMTVTSKLSIYFFLDCQLTSTLSSTTIKLQRKYMIASKNLWKSQGYAGNAGKNQASRARVVNLFGNAGANQPRVIRCYNCNGEGHIAKRCRAKKRDFLADSLEETDNYYDDEAIKNAIFMANLSPVSSINDDRVEPCYDSDILSEVPQYDTYHDSDMLNYNIQKLGYIENIVSNNKSYDELMSNSNVISYTDYMLSIGNDEDNYVAPPIQKNDMMLFVTEQMKSQVEKCNKVNQESKSMNESLTSELERYKDRVRLLEYAAKDGCSEKEAYLARELNTVVYLLTNFDDCIKRRTTLSPHEIGSWEQSDIRGAFKQDVIPFFENLKETFKLFKKGFIAEVKEMKDIFEQMEDEVDQCLLKIESKPINAYFKNNKAVHRDYLKVTKEHVAALQELLEEARELKPLDEHIGHASKFVERIQDLLVYIVEIVLWYLDFGCSKHMTGHHDKLINFVSKFIGLGHNLFPGGKFCDPDLKVKFLRTKDEAPEVIIKILKQAQVSLNAIIRYLHTDNDTEFLNRCWD
ncbi:putative reverse transcriptase domain-containing protein [Tanacetum coccineum]